MTGIPNVFSECEPWLHRTILRAGLDLVEQRGESQPQKEEIAEQLVYLYFTSPYESFRQACVPVLHAWKGTLVAERAGRRALSLLNELEALRDTAGFADTTHQKLPDHPFRSVFAPTTST